MSKTVYSVDLVRQMAICDANYIRLLKLVPQLRACRNRSSHRHAQQFATPNSRASADARPEKLLPGMARSFRMTDPDEFGIKITVEIRVVEAFRYTTTLKILQQPELKSWLTSPSMLVRVYHDASTAEVISYQGHRNFKPSYPQPNPRMYQADEKMQVNQFLGEWLSHCLLTGRSKEAPVLADLV